MINYIRKEIASNWIVTISLSVLLLYVTGCSTKSDDLIEAEFTDTEIFSGIFFLSGPLQQKIPLLSKYNMGVILNDEQTRDGFEAMQKVLLTSMIESGFSMEEFGREMRSKDPVRMNEAILSGAVATMNALYEMDQQEVVKIAIENPEILNELLLATPELEHPGAMMKKINDGEVFAEEVHEILEANPAVTEFLGSLEGGRTQSNALACVIAVVAAVVVFLFIEVEVAIDVHFGLWDGILENYYSDGGGDDGGPVPLDIEPTGNLRNQILVKELIEVL